jgi:RNA polymerase sigma-70 factor (ECF subfamily)
MSGLDPRISPAEAGAEASSWPTDAGSQEDESGESGTRSEPLRPFTSEQGSSDGASKEGAPGTDEEVRAEEIALVARIVGGDQESCADLVDRYQGRVFRMVRRMWSRERELAEDLTQEVFLRVFRGLPDFSADCSVGTWIHRITVNVCISELRQRKALKRDRRTISLDGVDTDGEATSIDPVDPSSAPGIDLERREQFDACRRAIDELPELWRVILTLRDLEDRSYEEIAEILELPIGTVRSRLHRARARVRAYLDAEQGAEA